ncbi:hypothetical protein BC936DRAFT_138685 [Jimgerdemannia flammicorona]|uniref:Uncharacterized protein n=1 Tax=Jimgerdemannia flammicorona TaxID=994334 RepID=A0A433BSH5_9FUNG|nr:hypothetical protein BC936DRAFT_138685 [Jimgerdemannia flammicorona]
MQNAEYSMLQGFLQGRRPPATGYDFLPYAFQTLKRPFHPVPSTDPLDIMQHHNAPPTSMEHKFEGFETFSVHDPKMVSTDTVSRRLLSQNVILYTRARGESRKQQIKFDTDKQGN